MAVRVAINGFGRIGRLAMRAALESGRDDVEFVAINDLGSADVNAHLLQYDSVHGRFPGDVQVKDGAISINGGTPIKSFAERDPTQLPWGELDIDVVMECTGFFASKEAASAHLTAGAKKVLISAPASGVDLTVVYGVNHKQITKQHDIISNASCTTNCLAPVADVLHETFGIKSGFMTTIHAYTGDQKLQDNIHSDLRRARAASLSMIPTSTGAARAVGLVLPELQGKLDGTSIRVPTANVSIIDLKFIPGKPATVDSVNEAMQKASNGKLKGVLDVNHAELVSVDFNHSKFSSIFDATQTQVVEGGLVRVMSWYDNEWGFSNRMSDTAVALAATI
ncbi:MAG: type I glyceraldehyde-3-phosphate dehydrogenase [Alphaproteobacteria bacterium]